MAPPNQARPPTNRRATYTIAPPARPSPRSTAIQFKTQPAFSIGDILTNSPGISIKQGNGPRDVGISIRGSNARNTFGVRNIQVLEDGFPVTQPDGLSRTDLTDPHAYSSIDIYRGPSSAMFGNYATGGAINFHTRPGGEINGYEFGSDVGRFGYFNNYLTLGRRSDQAETSLFFSDVRGGGFIEHSSFNTQTMNFLSSYAPTPNDKFTVKFIDNFLGTDLPIRLSLNQYRQNPFQTGCAIASPSSAAAGCASVALFANGLSGATVAQSADQAALGRHDQRMILGARWEHAIDDQTTWRTQAVFDNKNINQPTSSTSAIGDTPAYNLISDVTHRGQLLGLDATHSTAVYYNYQYLDNNTYNVAPGGSLGGLSSFYFGHQYNLGNRVRDEVWFTPNWTGVLAGAVERTNIEALNTTYTYPVGGGAPATTLFAVERDFYDAAWEAALRFRPNDEWQLRGRAATGYGTPQANNLFVTSQGVSGNNTQLQTQTNLGYDVGVDWTPSSSVKLSVTGFYEFFRNELVTQSPGAGLQSFTFNAPASEHRGVEIAADWRPQPGWRATAAYSFDDQIYTDYIEQLSAGNKTASFNRAGDKIPGVTPNEVVARLAYDQPSGMWRGLGFFVQYQWMDAFFIDNANLVKAPAYELVNVNVHYDTDFTDANYVKGAIFYFEIRNIFDRTYVASANNVSDSISAVTGAQNPATTVAAATGSIYAGAPRTYVAGMRLKFQ
jgi:iron complex outermembrane receptor protein